MHDTTPKVHLIMRPQLDWDVIHKYLESVDGLAWYDRVEPDVLVNVISDGEALIEFAARACYRSWAPGLNANVTKVRTDSEVYLKNILSSGHGSVLEHASYTFVFQDVSRVFTHELVRHRAGVAISQESLRYVRLTDIGFRISPILTEDVEGRETTGDSAELDYRQDLIVDLVEQVEQFQLTMAQRYHLDDEDTPFAVKKEVTSALRRLAPLGLSTTIIWTANVRTLRHVIEMRTAEFAEEEIRLVFDQVARIMKTECPLLFGDFLPTDLTGEATTWRPEWRKV